MSSHGGSGGGGGPWGQVATTKFKGAGSPNGVVTPSAEGDLYLQDAGGGGIWQSTDGTDTGWAPYLDLWGLTSSAYFSYTGSPVGNLTPFGVGDLCIDTLTPALWQATGSEAADWEQVGGGGGGLQPLPSSGAIPLGAYTWAANGAIDIVTTDLLISDAGDIASYRDGGPPPGSALFLGTGAIGGGELGFSVGCNGAEVIFGSAATPGLTIEDTSGGTDVITLPGLPTTDPGVVGQLWNNLGIVTVSAG